MEYARYTPPSSEMQTKPQPLPPGMQPRPPPAPKPQPRPPGMQPPAPTMPTLSPLPPTVKSPQSMMGVRLKMNFSLYEKYFGKNASVTDATQAGKLLLILLTVELIVIIALCVKVFS